MKNDPDQQATPALTLDGITYPFAELEGEVQTMVFLYQRWEDEKAAAQRVFAEKQRELDEAGYEIMLRDAAIRSLTIEIRARLAPLAPKQP